MRIMNSNLPKSDEEIVFALKSCVNSKESERAIVGIWRCHVGLGLSTTGAYKKTLTDFAKSITNNE